MEYFQLLPNQRDKSSAQCVLLREIYFCLNISRLEIVEQHGPSIGVLDPGVITREGHFSQYSGMRTDLLTRNKLSVNQRRDQSDSRFAKQSILRSGLHKVGYPSLPQTLSEVSLDLQFLDLSRVEDESSKSKLGFWINIKTERGDELEDRDQPSIQVIISKKKKILEGRRIILLGPSPLQRSGQTELSTTQEMKGN